MRLFFYGHEQLSWTRYEPVRIKEQKDVAYLKKIENGLIAVMEKYKRPGFTAPQMGIPIQMAAVRVYGGQIVTLINPRIERMYGQEMYHPETCISCPPSRENTCKVARMQIVEVSGWSIDKMEQETNWTFRNNDSRIVQHELDHLAGTFFFDRANVVDKEKVLEKFRQWKFQFKANGHAFAC